MKTYFYHKNLKRIEAAEHYLIIHLGDHRTNSPPVYLLPLTQPPGHRRLQNRPRPPLPHPRQAARGHRAQDSHQPPRNHAQHFSERVGVGSTGFAGRCCLHLQDIVEPSGGVEGDDGDVRLQFRGLRDRVPEIQDAAVRVRLG